MLLSGRRIFLVEDNPENIAVIQILLKNQGAELIVDAYASGQVQRVMAAMPLDLIILDLMLPFGRSGFDVFDELHRTPLLHDVPVVLVTAADAGQTLYEAQQRGFNGFIAKPIDTGLFPQQIAHIIQGGSVWHD